MELLFHHKGFFVFSPCHEVVTKLLQVKKRRKKSNVEKADWK